MNWKLTEKDGNPQKEGIYFVILIAPELKEYKMDKDGNDVSEYTGRNLAWYDCRYLAKGPINNDSWAMKDQPENADYYWTEQTGSSFNERVYAWMDISDLDAPELPEGVVWEQKSTDYLMNDKDKTMNETHDMIEALNLTTPTPDPRLQSARNHALKCLRSKAPIPRTILNIVERGAKQPNTDNNNK